MEEYLDRIQAEFFEPINSYKIIQEGWTNLVVEINRQWIFRFVRDRENTQIAVERDFLPIFAKVSPLNIPNLVLSGDDYIAYRKIAGDRFSPQNFLLFSNTQKANLFKLLGQFLIVEELLGVIYFALNHGFATQIPTILEYIEKLFPNKDYE